MNILILAFEILGTVAFAISGTVAALKKKMDLLGVITMGVVTAVGGGILRDVLLGQIPPKAFLNPVFTVIAIAVSLLSFLLSKKHFTKWHKFYDTTLTLMDAIGLGIFTVVGAGVSVDLYGYQPLLNIFMGTVSGVGGGVMRDIFCMQTPLIFTKHFYATASIIGAVLYTALRYLIDPITAGIAGVICIVLLRLLASKFLWNLPNAE